MFLYIQNPALARRERSLLNFPCMSPKTRATSFITFLLHSYYLLRYYIIITFLLHSYYLLRYYIIITFLLNRNEPGLLGPVNLDLGILPCCRTNT